MSEEEELLGDEGEEALPLSGTGPIDDDDDDLMERLDKVSLGQDPIGEVVLKPAKKEVAEVTGETLEKGLPDDFLAPERAVLNFAIPLPDVKGPTITNAVQKIVLYLKDLNIPVLRFHSDRASQFTSKELVQWFHKESIRVSTSVPGVPQGNGVAENAVKNVKQKTRTMLGAAGLGEEFWPMAAMAVTAQERAKTLNQVTKLAATFGTKVFVKKKKYADKRLPLRMEFEPRWREGIYMGLSDQVDEGHLVYVDGTFLHTRSIRPVKDLVDPGPPVSKEPLVIEEEESKGTRRRLREKTSVKVLGLQPGEEEEDLNDPELFAREVLYEELEIDEEIIAKLYDMIPTTQASRNLAENDKEKEEGSVSRTLWSAGAFVHGGILGLKKNTRKYPYTTRVVNQFIASKLPAGENMDPTWTTFSLFKNILTGPHSDSHNDAMKPSYLIPVSSFDDGGLWIEGKKDGEEVVVMKGMEGHVVDFPEVNGEKGAIEFLPRRKHATMPWKGERLVVAVYNVRNFERMNFRDAETLMDLGFHVPPNSPGHQKEVVLKKLTGPDPTQPPPQQDPPNLMLRVDVTHLRMEPEEWAAWRGVMTRDENNMTEGLEEQWRAIAPLDNEPDTWIPSTIFQDLERDWVEEPDVLTVANDGSLLHLARVLAIHSVDLVGSYENGDLEGERITVARINNRILQKEQFILFWEVRRVVPMDPPRPLVQIPMRRNGPEDPGEPHLATMRVEEPSFEALDQAEAYFVEVDVPAVVEPMVKKANVQELYTDNLEEILQALKTPLQVVHTCDPREASRNLSSWKGALEKEINAMVDMKAIRRLKGKEAKQFRERTNAVIVPSKLVYTAKPPSKEADGLFRRRVRAVACGNFEEEGPNGFGDLYAAGASIDAVRTVLAEANYKKWNAATDDIKNAFLTAPLEQGDGKGQYAMEPPRAAIKIGLAEEGELWAIDAAVYGFKKSPKWWTVFRNSVAKEAKWHDDEGRECWLEMAKTDANLFKIWMQPSPGKEKELMGYVVFYVGDILVVGSPTTLDGFFGWLGEHWETSGREDVRAGGPPVRFLGLELSVNEEGEFCVGQQGYLEELLRIHQVNGHSKIPIAKDAAVVDESPSDKSSQVDPVKLKEAQQRCGELLWASQRSRPDLSYAMAVMSSTVSKDPGRAVELGKKMLNYVKDSIDAKIHYPKVVENPGDLVLYTDASFSPQGTRSHSGYLVVWRGVVVAWKSGRQSMITLSSAESEVIAITEGAQMLKAVETTLNDLNIFPTAITGFVSR